MRGPSSTRKASTTFAKSGPSSSGSRLTEANLPTSALNEMSGKQNELRMWPGQDSAATAHLAVDHRCHALPRIHIEPLRIARQHLHAPIRVLWRIHKHAAAVVVAPEHSRHASTGQRLLADLQLHGPGAELASILEARVRAPAARPREQRQLARPHDRHRRVLGLELASRGAEVAARAEAKVRAAGDLEVVADAPGAGPVQRGAVARVGAARDDEAGGGGRPGLVEQRRGGDGLDGVARRQEAAEGVDGVADGLDGDAGAWRSDDQRWQRAVVQSEAGGGAVPE